MNNFELLEQVDTLRKALADSLNEIARINLELAMTDVERNEAVSMNKFYEDVIKENGIELVQIL